MISSSTHTAPIPVLRGPLRDVSNYLRRGASAPKAQERIWINPRNISRVYVRNAAQTPDFKRRHSGMVVDGDWDTQTEPLDASWKVAACLARFRDRVEWQDTGVYDRMTEVIAKRGSFDSCATLDDIKARYQRIDALYQNIREHGFRDDTQHQWGTARLPEGVFVHIDRHGDAIFGAIGNHRMGIARALGLTRIPAQLGVIHPGALKSGALEHYRDTAA